MDIDPEDKPSYTTQNQDTLLKDVQNEYCTKDTCLPVIKSIVNQRTISSQLKSLLDLVNLLKIHIISKAMMKNTKCLNIWLRQPIDKVIARDS
jgi:hypothetical protein